MTDEKKDQGSDALRSDPDNADRAREDIKRQAERGIEKAMRGDPTPPLEEHPEQDPAEGSREVIDRDLAAQETDVAGSSDNKTLDNDRSVSAGSEAAEPSPGS